MTSLIYFGVLEGKYGASLGKFLLGIRVVGKDQRRIGVQRALVRTAGWGAAVGLLPFAVVLVVHATPIATAGDGARAAANVFALGMLFVTARRSNDLRGYTTS